MMVDLVNPVNFLFKRQIDGTSSLKDAFFKQRLDAGINLYSNNLFGHVDTINAIEFSSDGGLLVSGKSPMLHLFRSNIFQNSKQFCFVSSKSDAILEIGFSF